MGETSNTQIEVVDFGTREKYVVKKEFDSIRWNIVWGLGRIENGQVIYTGEIRKRPVLGERSHDCVFNSVVSDLRAEPQ